MRCERFRRAFAQAGLAPLLALLVPAAGAAAPAWKPSQHIELRM